MGVVGDQPRRDFFGSQFEIACDIAETAQDVAHRFGIEMSDAIRLFHIVELRRANNIAVQDGDYRDEHIAGICDALNGLKKGMDVIVANI